MLLVAITDAQAQKKPKTKGLAKEIIGEWTIDDLEARLDEGKADSVQKGQFALMQTAIKAMKEEMRGKLSYTFKPDGTYTRKAERRGNTSESKGTWTLEGKKLKLKPEVQESNMPEFFEVSMVNKKLHLEAPPSSDAPMPMPVYTIMKLIRK